MIMFIRDIPSETKKYEIASFIERVFNHCFLGRPSATLSIADIEILSIQDVDSNTLEKHGLVRISPKEVAKRVIKKLDGTIFKGTRVTVREYINRSAHNDPRNELLPDTTINFKERRASDRRREPLMNSWQKAPILVHAVHVI
ncbi:MAG: hypothetical protein ACU88J_02635 [Gammaproteobacteria bacterium]